MNDPSPAQNTSDWNVIVIGAGAAGLMAAARSAQRGNRTLLLEKNNKIGVKILMSGGTRCNITHNCDSRGIIAAFGKNGRFLHSALAGLSPKEVINMIESQGVATKIEDTGKIFPVSNHAIDVRDALWRIARESGAKIISGAAVEQIDLLADDNIATDERQHRFLIRTAQHEYRCRSVVITTGGKSYPGCGTTGDGYEWAKKFGHSIVTPCPALTPILSNCHWALDLKGVTLERVLVQVLELSESSCENSRDRVAKPRLLAERESSLLFTHWGFSGPAALDVSGVIARHSNRKQLLLVCDFWPSQSIQDLTDLMMQRKLSQPKLTALHLFPAELPKRFLESLMQAANVSPATRNADLTKKEIGRLVDQLKRTQFSTTGTLGFEKAEVTSGGVSLDEIDSKTMQSKLVEGLFFAGEVLDLDGRIGGFNFQSAFSTGWLAGKWV
jgi:predicted Rossmann fold flavoprotein